jgi:hypothetical protein
MNGKSKQMRRARFWMQVRKRIGAERGARVYQGYYIV